MTPAKGVGSVDGDHRFALSLTLQDGGGFQFAVDFEQPGVPPLLVDEPAPLGKGAGPNPARLLAAAIGDCLGASLLYCLRKSRVEVRGLRVDVDGTMVRNERGRLRIGELRVKVAPDVPVEQVERMDRCLELFEDFCIVTESVREGIRVDVEVAMAGVAG